MQQTDLVAKWPEAKQRFISQMIETVITQAARWPDHDSSSKPDKPEGVDAMDAPDQVLFDKIKQLPPQRMAVVEDFVDFLRAREDERRLTQAATKASKASFAKVWDNDEDAAYDRL